MILKKLFSWPIADKLLLLTIIIFSLAFRLTNLGLIEFKTDEATNIFLAAQPLFGHPLSPGGTVSSLGVLNPPVFNYMLLPILFFSFDPRIISFFIAIANVAAIVGLFLLVKKYYSLQIAFISSLLLSLSPWAILYSRKIWMQDLLMPFLILLLLSTHKIFIDKKQKYWFIYGFSSLMLIQLHQISIIFILIITSFLLIKKVKIDFKYLILGISLAFLPLIPYLIYEVNNHFPDLYALINTRNKLNSHYSVQIFMRPFQIINIGDFRFVLGDDTLTFAQKFPLIYKARQILYLEYLLLPIGLFLFIKKYKNSSFLGYSSLLTIAVYFILKIEAFMHYYIILIPLLFIFLATTISFLISNKNVLIKISGFIIFLSLIISLFLFDIAFFDLLNTQRGLKGDYSTPFSYQNKENTSNMITGNYDLKEKTLASYIPLSYMYGYEPLGKILYSKINSKDIFQLEQSLRADPTDKRVQFKLLAFFTQKPETPDTINMLKQKSQLISSYMPIYKDVYQRYLSVNHKKEFTAATRKFFYPEHWDLKNENGIITLTGDGYQVEIKNFENDRISFTCNKKEKECNEGTILEMKTSVSSIY